MKWTGAIALTFIAVLLLAPQLSVEARIPSNDAIAPLSEGLIENVPYVWQEINGLCAWAATSVAVQAAGVDLDLHDVLAATGVGFSFAYVRYNDTWLMYPGAIYMQAEPTQFLADLYGLNLTMYFDTSTPSAEQLVEVWEGRGINSELLDGQNDALALMKSTIDEGYPLLISVNPAWLPAFDYDYLRDLGASGGAHGILIVGYNDTDSSATIIDPGVGSFGENFGYPEDGRGNYTKITYTNLIQAWSDRYFITVLLKSGGTPAENPSKFLGEYIRDRLLGIGAAYYADPSTAILWKFGEGAFRGLSEDFTVQGLTEYFDVFTGMEGEREFKASLLMFLGLGLEAQVTLQYLSYRASLQALPSLTPDVDLTAFLAAGQQALSHFEAITDNSTLVFPSNLTAYTGPVASIFMTMADEYNSTGNLEAVLTAHQSDLDEVSIHLLEIADSWLAAGNALAEIWPNNPLVIFGPYLALAAFGVGALVVVVIIYIRKTPSQ
ncbi:MAG: hypothetical protein ACFFAD_13525 [Candidatus Hermodarchaeota archaeon]